MPSQLLERRPDIAAAERRAQEGNEAIGIAQSAFYPQLVFGASAGYQSTAALQSVFSPASVVYSLGPGIAYTFFEGGRRKGVKQEALAQFDRNAASYKQTVITAFQQTEDNLVALRVLADEQVQQRNATNAALESQRIFNNRTSAASTPSSRSSLPKPAPSPPNATTSTSSAVAWTPPSTSSRPWAEAGTAPNSPRRRRGSS